MQDLLPAGGRVPARDAEAWSEVDTLIAAADGEGGGLRGRAVDRRVLDRYRLLERLGSGGFGEVWRAADELLRREVAVKRIPCVAEEVAERAAREAQATARLSHPGIVALYEAAEQGGDFYLISELVHGHTLARVIAEDSLSDEEIVEVGLALCEALDHAHGRGVIHRDVKPQNILVPDEPLGQAAAKLTDFGGARLDGEQALTRTGDVLGTLAYMAPEQSEGLRAGPEADLYSLALVLYEALSGENPVRAATPAATVRRIGSDLPSLRRVRADLPPQLTEAIDRALRPQPRQRGSLATLADALTQQRSAAVGTPPPRRRPASSAPAEDDEADETLPPWPRTIARSKTHEVPPPDRVSPPDETRMPAEDRPRRWTPPPVPRFAWAAIAIAVIAWQAMTGRAGLALLLLAGALPLLLAMPRRASPAWLTPVLAPLLGLAGLAAAFPALAGWQASVRTRAAVGALGYWWLCLAEVALRRGIAPAVAFSSGLHAAHAAAGPPTAHLPAAWAPPGWEQSAATAAHALAPLLSPAALCGALLWGAGTVVLPWLVRGASLAADLILAGAWSAALLAGPPLIAASLQSGSSAASAPAVAILGAALGALAAAALAQGGRASSPPRP